MNYYEILDLTLAYDIDLNELRKKYLLAQNKYHPDQVQQGTEKIDYIEKSSLINIAYKTLSDDYKRAVYLLKCFGRDMESNDARKDLSREDLEKIWDDNELLDRLNDQNSLKRIEQEKLREKQLLISAISNAFQQKNFENALELTIKLKYLTNLVKNISLKIQNANN